jgi:hypothetical protein
MADHYSQYYGVPFQFPPPQMQHPPPNATPDAQGGSREMHHAPPAPNGFHIPGLHQHQPPPFPHDNHSSYSQNAQHPPHPPGKLITPASCVPRVQRLTVPCSCVALCGPDCLLRHDAQCCFERATTAAASWLCCLSPAALSSPDSSTPRATHGLPSTTSTAHDACDWSRTRGRRQ